MTEALQQVVDAARALSPKDKLELVEIISGELNLNGSQRISEEFWRPRSLDEIARNHASVVVTNVDDLVGDFWPQDESVDEFNQFIAEERENDRAKLE